MLITGSGGKRNDERTVKLTFRGTDQEFIRLIDALEMAEIDCVSRPAGVLRSLKERINFHAGMPVDHIAPAGDVELKI